ncbi:MAG TPA: DNA translocase FtsK 4TM domain-containing protein, partial [Pseudothauera hydrothermalis]|nr:DNA translocase FtsK 4TM domain-containing protein [Pseudothauera hydrothermalis]
MAKKKRTTKKSSRGQSSYEPRILPALESFWASISPDRKLDALGILLAAIGVLTLLLVFSGSPGSVGAAWLRLLRGGLGWGLYLFPVALIVLGVWLVLRHFERIPPLRLRRLVGIGFLFGNLLLLLHAFLFPLNADAATQLAEQGMGGGNIGAALYNGLLGGLGSAGMWVGALTWLVIGVLLAFDLPASSLVAWLPPLLETWRTARKPRELTAEWPPYEPAEPVYADNPPESQEAPARPAMEVTPEQMLDDEYLFQRAKLIDPKRAQDFGAGNPVKGGTIYLTAADESGMMISFIQSNYMGFGSGVVVPGYGVSLQNRG